MLDFKGENDENILKNEWGKSYIFGPESEDGTGVNGNTEIVE